MDVWAISGSLRRTNVWSCLRQPRREEGAAGRETNEGIDTEVRSVICALAVELFTCVGDVPSYSSFSGDDRQLSLFRLHESQSLDLLKGFVGFLSVVGNRLPT